MVTNTKATRRFDHWKTYKFSIKRLLQAEQFEIVAANLFSLCLLDRRSTEQQCGIAGILDYHPFKRNDDVWQTIERLIAKQEPSEQDRILITLEGFGWFEGAGPSPTDRRMPHLSHENSVLFRRNGMLFYSIGDFTGEGQLLCESNDIYVGDWSYCNVVVGKDHRGLKEYRVSSRFPMGKKRPIGEKDATTDRYYFVVPDTTILRGSLLGLSGMTLRDICWDGREEINLGCI